MTDPQKRGWFDTTIKLEWILGILVLALAGAVGTGWRWTNNQDRRVTRLENNDREQEKHFSRIEGALQEQRTDNRDSLRSLKDDVKDLGVKIDQLKDQMISNSVAARPDMQRWAK